MAEQQCSSNNFIGWVCPNPGCVYGITLRIRFHPNPTIDITNLVNIDCSMSAMDIQNLLMANRINGFTGTITVSIVGAQLNINISNVNFPDEPQLGDQYTIQVTNPGGGCGSIPSTIAFFSCVPAPPPKKKNKRFGAFAMQRCPDEIIFREEVQHPKVSYCNQIYNFYEKDADGLLHYINSRSNINLRGTVYWSAISYKI